MKKHPQPLSQSGTAWFIGLSLLVFAFVFLLSSFALNNSSKSMTRAKRVRAVAPAGTASDPNYTIEETADPFVTKVIKK
jgi:hypothetical protein